ncbi:DUF1365 domain-containing protein [Hyphobacterium sp.]|uniref:DUF1365 domain-containing protein n=1 Tax=Hyphobacterium sp. TaxID=2004662 RepID=UPI003BAA2319
MSAPLAIWRGTTVHKRLQPFEHAFKYPVAMIGVDLNRLDEAGQVTKWLAINKSGPFSFCEKDFGARDGSSLRDWSLARFHENGIKGVDRVYFICQPRILGYQFNPISLHFGYAEDGALLGIIYEVHNTFGDAHAYVAPVSGEAVERHNAEKNLHVSPFFDVSGEYAFALQPPDEALSLAIRKAEDGEADFRASMTLEKRPATGMQFFRWFTGFPLSTLFTIGAIHFEAARLWIKGARYHNRPEPPRHPATPVLESQPQKQ